MAKMAVDFNYPPVSNQLDTIHTFQPEAFSARDLDNGKLRRPNILISVSTKWVKTMILSFHQALKFHCGFGAGPAD